MANPTAAVLIIGNEILSGRTQDANLNYIATRLAASGISLAEARVVTDDEKEIVDAVNALRKRYTYVFTTGGIGPTHDDITFQSIAAAFGRKVVEHPDAIKRLLSYYDDPSKLNVARRRMALLPEGAELIDNPISAAPGARVDNVFVLPGVPSIMQAMLEALVPTLTGGPPIVMHTVTGAMLEGQIAAELAAIAGKYGNVSIGSYPNVRSGKIVTSLVVRGADAAQVKEAANDVLVMARRYDAEAAIS